MVQNLTILPGSWRNDPFALSIAVTVVCVCLPVVCELEIIRNNRAKDR